jgi:RNA polymerase sigma-70 factor (ECF subfamily)
MSLLQADRMMESDLNDFDIARRVLAGRTELFEVLLARHQDQVARIVSGKVPDRDFADVTQEVFVRAYRSLSGYSGQKPFQHWLSVIAVRTCTDYWRDRYRRPEVLSGILDDQEGTLRSDLDACEDPRAGEKHSQREIQDLMERTLTLLPAQDRMILVLHYLEGRSLMATAQLMEISLANAKVRAMRAKRKLRKLIEERMGVRR